MENTFITYYQSPLGWLRIEGTPHFVSGVNFADSLDDQPPGRGTEEPMAIQAIEQLIQYFHGNRRIFELPVSQDGTEFQQRVWTELMNIPYGRTTSYLDMARKLGDPKVIRAAASANGRNQLSIIVPCHRVIGSNRELIGYAGGLWRKKWLLDHENKVAHGVQTLF